ncbi:hypothetical protein [Pseudomonas sp. ACN5]|uniref:hypothetical protein n=1 Tax=Pseudomonas sp. ACN5 TaxID=1920427 RepID=UPI001144E5BC|nr:hypothetical protein [Pseudomonas sp. ACN5]
MSEMTISEFFNDLGAKLNNDRWSWGAVREADGAVFLRVWRDEREKFQGDYLRDNAPKLHVHIFDLAGPRHKESKLGHNERKVHLDLINRRVKVYLVMCDGIILPNGKRQITGYDSETLYIGGRTTRRVDGWWIELGDEVPVRDVRI